MTIQRKVQARRRRPSQGEGSVEGGWVDRVVGLEGVRVEYAMMETPDGHGRLELVKFHAPSSPGGDRHAPANTPGLRHLAFAVEDIDAVVAGLRAHGAELVGEVESWRSRSAEGKRRYAHGHSRPAWASVRECHLIRAAQFLYDTCPGLPTSR